MDELGIEAILQYRGEGPGGICINTATGGNEIKRSE